MGNISTHEKLWMILWIICVLLAAAIISKTAHARPLPYSWLPPVELDHPYRGGKLSIVTRSLRAMPFTCMGRAYACAYRTRAGCTIYIPPVDNVTINAEGRQLLIRHEIGHCNGWPANHPNGRFG